MSFFCVNKFTDVTDNYGNIIGSIGQAGCHTLPTSYTPWQWQYQGWDANLVELVQLTYNTQNREQFA